MVRELRSRAVTPVRTVHTEAVVHDDPSPRARVINRGIRMTAKPFLHIVPVHDRMFRRIKSLERLNAKPPSPDIHVEPIALGGVSGERLTPLEGVRSSLTLMYFHGGGFFTGSVSSYRALLEAFVRETGGTIVAVDYVQLPDGTVADSVRDAICAYADLVGQVPHPDRVVVAGDSAGGYLTMKVAELATRRGLPKPAALIGFSPLLSLDPDNPDKNVLRVSPVSEAYLPARRTAMMRRRWLPEGAVIEGFADPLHATHYISSPVHLVAVEDEMLRPEVEAFALLLTDKGVPVDLHVWRGQIHAFPILADVLPDAALATRLAAEFALRSIGEEPPVRTVDTSADVEDVAGQLAD